MTAASFFIKYELIFKLFSFFILIVLFCSIIGNINLEEVNFVLLLSLILFLFMFFLMFIVTHMDTMFSIEKTKKMFKGLKFWTTCVFICSMVMLQLTQDNIHLDNHYLGEKGSLIHHFISEVGEENILVLAFCCFSFSQIFFIKKPASPTSTEEI